MEGVVAILCLWYTESMSVITIPKTLREKLGDDGVDALLTVFSEVSLNTRNDLATKSDIKDMATKDDIKSIRQEMATKADLSEESGKLRLEIEKLRVEIEKSSKENIRWMLAFGATQVGILIAAMAVLLKLFIK